MCSILIRTNYANIHYYHVCYKTERVRVVRIRWKYAMYFEIQSLTKFFFLRARNVKQHHLTSKYTIKKKR